MLLLRPWVADVRAVALQLFSHRPLDHEKTAELLCVVQPSKIGDEVRLICAAVPIEPGVEWAKRSSPRQLISWHFFG